MTITFDGPPEPRASDLASQLASIPEYVQHGASLALELALHAAEVVRIQSEVRHGRGHLVPLTRTQRMQRAFYLAGLADITSLDPWVRRDGAPMQCPDGFYLLKDYNGGKDPTAPDPFDRWSKRGSTFVNRTSDCIGGAAWIGGWDRYQPVRFSHIYSGWINTDSMRKDAAGPAKCFARIATPEPGCYVVCGSGSPGHKIGHIGTVVGGCDDFDRKERASWQALEVVDVASRSPRRANMLTTGKGWFGADAWFIVPVMKP